MTTLCSPAWDALSGAGTAPVAAFWVALEQPGAWGRDAFAESRLPPGLGKALEAACQDAGGRALLIRRVGSGSAAPGARQALVSGGPAAAPWLLAGVVDDPAALLQVPFARLAEPEPPAIAGLSPHPAVALVCTNSKRDTCCALRGRPAAELAERLAPGRVWECSHTGGHRFAPTAVVLPTGQLLAHATAADLVASVQAADNAFLAISGPHDRGRSQLAPPAQAAEGWVRQHERALGLGDLASIVSDDLVTVTHRDGRRWQLVATREETGEDLPESCGKPGKPVVLWRVEPAPAHRADAPGTGQKAPTERASG